MKTKSFATRTYIYQFLSQDVLFRTVLLDVCSKMTASSRAGNRGGLVQVTCQGLQFVARWLFQGFHNGLTPSGAFTPAPLRQPERRPLEIPGIYLGFAYLLPVMPAFRVNLSRKWHDEMTTYSLQTPCTHHFASVRATSKCYTMVHYCVLSTASEQCCGARKKKAAKVGNPERHKGITVENNLLVYTPLLALPFTN